MADKITINNQSITSQLEETAPLPEWLQASVRDVLKQLDDSIRQHGINVKQPPYNAPADGNSHPLSERFTTLEEAQAIFSAATALTDEIDWAALQTALNKAANTGEGVYAPTGRYKTGLPLTLKWTATPEVGLPSIPKLSRFVGDGDNTIIEGTISTSGRAILELLGESNTYSVNTKISSFKIRMRGGSSGSYCLRVGDAKESFSAYQVKCQGANGLLLKISSSSSYAQMNTYFEECTFRSNYALEWYADDAQAEVYAVTYESGGAKWDNVKFQSCMFGGLVETRASSVSFDSCQFSTPVTRPTTSRNFANNLSIRIGNASVRDCYFEDHHTAIEINPSLSQIDFVTIEGCRFSGVNNSPETLSKYGVYIAGTNNRLGSVKINNCAFGDVDVNGVRLYEQASIFNTTGNSVEINGVMNTFKPNTPIKIINSAGNFSVTHGEAKQARKVERVTFSGTLSTATGTIVLKKQNTTNISSVVMNKQCWISGIRVFVDGLITGGTVNFQVKKNGASFKSNNYPADFTRLVSASYEQGYLGAIAGVFDESNELSVSAITSSLAPTTLLAIVEIELAY